MPRPRCVRVGLALVLPIRLPRQTVFRTPMASCSSVQLTALPHQRIFKFCAPLPRARGSAGPSPPSLIDNSSSVSFATVISGRRRQPALHRLEGHSRMEGRLTKADTQIINPLESAFTGQLNAKPFRIRTYEKAVSNPFRICTYKKRGRGYQLWLTSPLPP